MESFLILCLFSKHGHKKLVEQIEMLRQLKRMEVEDFIQFLATQEKSEQGKPALTFSWQVVFPILKISTHPENSRNKRSSWMTGNAI